MRTSHLAVTALFSLAGPQWTCAVDLTKGTEWMSLSKSVEFMPAKTQGSSQLRSAQHRLLNYYKDDFVDGLETQYNEYAQAWRYMGLYIDCNAAVQNAQRRDLEEQNNGENTCKRYLLWGAYVDLEYEGNGLSEYMIYNAASGSWDKNACKAANSNRCAKMDCHSKNTHYKTLGFFRQDAPVEFLNLLNTYQGSCSFSDGEANAMADGLEWLPQQCTQSATQDGSNYLYFDLKPKSNGDIDVGLYTDAKCSMEYNGSAATAQSVLTTHTGYDVALEENLANINQALDTFKVCTPCRTFDLSYTGAAAENAENGENADNGEEADAEGEDEAAEDQGERRAAEDNGDPNNAKYVCVDDAGNYGANQCMIFAKNSEISAASIREVSLANGQGTITSAFASMDGTETWWQGWGFFLMSFLAFLLGLLCFCSVAVKRKRISSSSKNEALLAKQ